MIKAEELRLNNWVAMPSSGAPTQITAMDISDIQSNLKNRLPIQLTPAILEKCPDVIWHPHSREFKIGKLKFTYEKNELSEFVRFHYSGKVRYIQYLHDLQNVVSILTQTELTINL